MVIFYDSFVKFYVKKLEICQSGTDAPAQGHYMREKIVLDSKYVQYLPMGLSIWTRVMHKNWAPQHNRAIYKSLVMRCVIKGLYYTIFSY